MLGILGHYNKGLYWYLSDIISKSQPSQFKAIVQTETFNEDMKRFFQIDTVDTTRQKSNYSKKFDIPEDSESISNYLKDLLKNEYKIYDAINAVKNKIWFEHLAINSCQMNVNSKPNLSILEFIYCSNFPLYVDLP